MVKEENTVTCNLTVRVCTYNLRINIGGNRATYLPLALIVNMYSGLRKTLSNSSTSVLKTVIRRNVDSTLSEAEGVTTYPPVLDLSRRARLQREKEEFHNKIKKLETVEEKLYGINMPYYYGWKSLHIQEGAVPYNGLEHAQFMTRTHVIKDSNFPEFYNLAMTNERLDGLVQTVKRHVEDALILEYWGRRREHEFTEEIKEYREKMIQNVITRSVIHQINRIMLVALSPTVSHLLEVNVDFEPRIEAFWLVGAVRRPSAVKSETEKVEEAKEYEHQWNDIPVQYFGSPILQLRHRFPLGEILSTTDSSNPELTVPVYICDPSVLSYRYLRKHAACIPGFWPGDMDEFGILSYHDINNIPNRVLAADEDAVLVQAIYASYSWLLSQACYQGFSTVNDITYPLVTQTVLTNGQFWSFCVYQLNTTLLHSNYSTENPKRNVCWITESMKLFEKIEDGKVYGFNDDVLKKLIRFYINMPVERTGVNMKPYLGESVKYIADIANRDRRIWLEEQFKHLVSNRPRHLKIPQIYDWQKIYLIRHKTRPMDKRRDPWQFGYNPWKRRLDDHVPKYVPKKLRENPKKKKVGRWAKTYYPDV